MSPLRTFRDAALADATLVARIVNLAYEIEKFFVDGERTSPDEVRVLLGKGRFIVMEEDHEPVGCVYLELKDGRGFFAMLSVLPALQGGGRGRALVEVVERTCRDAGCAAVELYVVDLREELPAFYARLGYRPIAEKPFESPVLKRPAKFIVYSKSLGAARSAHE